MTYYSTLQTPPGPVLVAVDEHGALVRVEFLVSFTEQDALRQFGHDKAAVRDEKRTAAARAQIEEYFAGKRRVFDLPLVISGTDFQKQVWQELLKIPFGETRTYGQLAVAIGRPKACRAVGRANGANRIPIVIPCHRVIGADGSLTGFASGTDVKAILLELEGIRVR